MKIKFFLLILMISTITFSESKIEKIRSILDLIGTDKNIELMKTQFIGIIKESDPNVPSGLIDSLFSRMNKEGFYKLIIAIYDKNLDKRAIDGIARFYKTEAGKQLIEKMPVIMQESMQAGAVWGQQIMAEIVSELKKRGYKVNEI